MKTNLNHRVIAMLLAVLMLLGVMPMTAFANADDRPKLNLVSFGDSMTNGYGHEGYYAGSTQVNGFRQNDVITTYPYHLMQMLESTYDVNWEALAVSCMRTEDVNFLLRYHTDEWDENPSSWCEKDDVDSWNTTVKSKWNSTFVDDGKVIGDYFTWNEFVKDRFNDWGKVANDETNYPWDSNPTLAYAKYYQDAVKKADVITLGTGNANFGVIMLQNITSYLTGTFGSTFKDAVPVREVLQRRLPAEIVPTALEILDKVDDLVVPKLDKLDEVKAAKVLEIVEHTTVSFMFSYMDMLYAIDELNDKDNLDIIMMGLMNTMDGVKINTGNGDILDLGAVVDGITDVLSAYYFVLPVALQELNGDFENITFYIVPNDDHIEMQVSDMASLEKIQGSNILRERMIQEVSGMIFDLVRGPLNTALSGKDVELPTWSMNDNTAYQYREKVEAYELLQADYEAWVKNTETDKGAFDITAYGALFTTGESPAFSANDALACAVYLAFERAIIKNADNATLDLNGLMALMGGDEALAGMMGSIAGSLTNALGVEAQTALTNKVTASVAAQLVAAGIAQYNTDPIKTAIGDRITEVAGIISYLGSYSLDTSDATTLKTGLEAIKDQPLVPAGIWYDLSLTNEDTTPNMTNMASVGATLLAFANSMDATKEGNVVAAPTAMFTAIELTNALNGALGGALVSEDAASLGGLLSLFARMIIGNGIGSHPTAAGHETLFNEIMEVYPDKPAKVFLTEVVKDTAEMLYQLAKAGQTDKLDKIVDFALEQGLIDEAQAELIKAQLPKIYVAVYEQDDKAIMNSCKKLAVLLYDYGRENGYINDEIHAIVTEAIRVYTDVKDMDEDEIIEYTMDYITTLLDEHGTEILDAVKLFAIEQGWVTEDEISACTAKIDAVKVAVESRNAESIASAVKDLAEFLSEVYKAKEPALEALKDQFMGLYAKLEWYATPRKAGPYTNVVTIGASNVNGYGLRGYLKPTGDYTDDTVMEAAALNSALKSNANVLGYNQAPAGSYPALLKKALEEQQGNEVKLDQLAISSMRVEELRILLDNNYNGDAYSAWRFIGEGKWFDIADGTSDGDFSQLRSEYQTAVKNADLITVDIGVNNFGVYLSYMLTSNFSLDNNLELVDPQIGKLYNDAKAQVNKLLAEYDISVQDYEELADTLVYALVGFCYNFDKSMERIYELNPDATVVVVSIQNLMAGLKAEIGGIEVPFGDMMGALVNTANAYIHYASPFAAKYLYTDVAGDEGRVEFFIDKMAAYDGNPANLDKNIIDCFDVWDGNPNASYDGGFHVKYQLNKLTPGNFTPEQLNKAYDAYAQIMSTCAKYDTLDLSALTVNSKPIEAALTTGIWNAVQSAVTTEGTYTLPDDFFSQIATDCGVSESVVKTIAAMAVRTDIGNSFFGHPTPAGHKTVADKILNTLNYEKTGLDWLYENTNNLDEKLYDLAVKYGPVALEYVKDYAVKQGWITAEQIALIEREVNAAIDAYNTKDYKSLLANCKAIAKFIYGHKDDIAEYIESIKPELEEIGAKLYDLAVKYGPAALEYVKDYAVEQGWITAEQIALIEREVNAAIEAYNNKDYKALYANCKAVADFIYEHKDKINAYIESVKPELEEIGAKLYDLAVKYGPEALTYVKNYAIAQGWITAEQIALIEREVNAAIDAYNTKDYRALYENCKAIAKFIYGHKDDIAEYIESIKPELEEIGAKLYDLAVKYGPEALEYVKDYAVEQGWITADQIALIEREVNAAIDAYNTKNYDAVLANCKAMAELLKAYAEAHPEEVEALVGYAKAELEKLGAKLYDLAVKYGPEALEYVKDYAVEQGWITADQIALIEREVNVAIDAYNTKNYDAVLANCKAMAKYLYEEACKNGFVPAEVQEAIAKAIEIYGQLADMTPEELKACVKAQLMALAEKYGPEALEKLNEYVLSLDVLDERQLGELEEKIWDFIQMYPNAPDATIDAAIDELVDFLFGITELDKDKVMAMYHYLTKTSKEQMLADVAGLMQKYLEQYGPEVLEYVKNYLIAEGYVTADEIAEITKQVELAIAAYEAQDKAAVQASCMKLAELVYAYADQNGYIPAEVKEAYAKAIELYNKYGEMTPEQIKAFAVAELKKLIAEHKAEALIALQTYVVNEGWVEKANDLKALAEKIAAAIAAYKADPEGIADAMVEELVSYLYEKAVAEGYIDPAKVDELHKFVDLIKAACEYFVNTSEEQMRADAIALMFDELDKLTDGKINARVYAQVKSDVAGLIATLEDITPESIGAKVDAYINSIKAKYLALIDDATHGKYIPDGESYYVVLGGDTVYGTGIGKYDDGYFDLLLEELGLDGKTQYKNLGEKNLDLTKLLAYIEKNADEIKKADLITYQADATTFILAALNEETPDWSRYLTAEQIAFVEQALPVIQTILEDDWTKYADLDADKIVDDIKSEVFGAIDDAIMDAFNGQADKLDELLSICVAQVKSYVEYIQEQAVELYCEAVFSELVLYYSLMEPVYEVLDEEWAFYAELDVEQIVSKIKSEVLAKAGEVKTLSEAKVNELLMRCVEKALELHEYADAEIAKLPEYFSNEELAFAQAAFEFVWEYAVKQWPELAELDVEELHGQAYAEIMKLLTEADSFNYEQYVDLGAEKIEEILNCCIDKVMAAIEDIQSEAVEAVMVIDNAEAKFLEEAFKFAFDYLVEDWGTYVDKSAAWISNQIKDAVIAEMYKYSSFGKEYIDQYADDLAAILTTCIEEVQNVLQTAQNQKDEVLNVLNTIEPFKPYIENLLFASVAYAVDTAKAVDAIQAINPDATLIVVGMYNPLDGLEIVMNGKTIDVGAYMDYLIDATNVYYTALAVADGEFTFVAVPDTEINGFETAINVDELNVAQLGSMLLKLNDSMYASVDGHEYIFKQIIGALDTTNDAPEVDNRTKETAGTFDAVVTFEDNNKTAVVECDQACVVLAATVDEDGKISYTRLTGDKDETTGAYTFDLSGIVGEFSLVVALKGDANLDGVIDMEDATSAMSAWVNGTTVDALTQCVMNVSEGEFDMDDATAIMFSWVMDQPLTWDIVAGD